MISLMPIRKEYRKTTTYAVRRLSKALHNLKREIIKAFKKEIDRWL